MTTLVFDLEANGFLDTLTKIHCLSYVEIDNGKRSPVNLVVGAEDIREFISERFPGNRLCGHNILAYDLPALQKCYPEFTWDINKVVDTLVVSSFVYPHMLTLDATLRKSGTEIPNDCFGRHSLEAWGYRLKCHKGDFEGPWDEYTEEMGEYCKNDSVVTERLLNHLSSKKPSSDASRLEHRMKQICLDIERRGWTFNEQECVALAGELAEKKAALLPKIRQKLPHFYKRGKEFIPKRDNSRFGYVEEAPLSKVTLTEFNPDSRHHIEVFLRQTYGWKPLDFTQKGNPKIDDEVVGKLEYPEAELLSENLLLQKRLSQIMNGDKAWLKMVIGGRIHCRINPMGTDTSRGAHYNPNLGQVPAKRSPYGEECRRLFQASPGRVLVGSDLKGLELRCLANRMAPFDKGAYVLIVLEGDPHTENQHAAGIQNRDDAKTFFYAFIYGAGPAKIGSIVGKGFAEGKKLIEKFFTNLPALGRVVTLVKRKARSGFLEGLDGRRIPVRSQHSALNFQLQSDGAILAKRWIVFAEDEIAARGLQNKAEIIGWVHDEVIYDCDPQVVEEVEEILKEAAIKAGEYYTLNIPIEADAGHGDTWLDIH